MVIMAMFVMVIVLVIIMIVVIMAFISMLIGMNLSIEMFSFSPHQSGTDSSLKRQYCAVA